MRRLLTIALLIGGAAVLLTASPAAPSGSKPTRPEARCKFVIKRVHGHRKRVKVCKRKPKPTPKPAPKPKADLVLSATSSVKQITAGNQFVYEVGFANIGPASVTGAELSITVPAGTEIEPTISVYSVGSGDTLEPECEGSSEGEDAPFVWRCRLSGELPPADPEVENPEAFRARLTIEPEHGGPFVIEAKAEGPDTVDPHPENNDVTTTIDVADGPASADLSVSVEAAPDPALVLDDFVETIKVTNHGPTEATSVRVPILLPLGVQIVDVQSPSLGGDCYYGTGPLTATVCWDVIQSGETAEAKVVLAPIGTAPPTLETNLLVTAYTPDPDLSNNRASAMTAVAPFTPVPGVDLGVRLYPPRIFRGGGEYVVVPVALLNRGTQEVTGGHVVVIASGPVGESGFALFDESSGELTIGPCETTPSGTKDCVIRSLSGASRLNGYFFAELSGTGELKVTLTAIADTQDANPADNTASVSLQVGPSPGRR